MPLRDHFHPPVSKRSSWEGFHGGWPMQMVAQLLPQLPDGFVAEPRVHLGSYYEIDVSAFEQEREHEPAAAGREPHAEREDYYAQRLSAIVAPAPTLTIDAEFPEQYSYEVLIFDLERERRLVAAIEIVSPANKDRPESRHLFVAKCLNLLRQDVCVSVIDLVSIRQFNLFDELLALIGHEDAASHSASPIYAATCRKKSGNWRTKVDNWFFPLTIGRPLPVLPIWLTETLSVSLDLEASYEETCRLLRIP